MVRDFHRVIGEEARKQILKAEAKLPTAIIACVGGGSNAIGIFHAFLNDPGVQLIGVEAGGRGHSLGEHAARFGAAATPSTTPPPSTERAAPASCRAPTLMCCKTRAGQIAAHPLRLRRTRLPGHRTRARLAARSRPRRIRLRRRPRSPRRPPPARPSRRHHLRPRVRPRRSRVHQARPQDEPVRCGDRQHLRPRRQRHRHPARRIWRCESTRQGPKNGQVITFIIIIF